MTNLKNKKVIITGASGGIGERMAWQIARCGGIPILVARSEDKMKRIAKAIFDKYQQEVFYYPADLVNAKQVKQVFTKILTDHDCIDGLINNAGTGKFQYAWEVDPKETMDMFRLNVFAVMEANQQLFPRFLAQGHGHIVIVASQAAKVATPKASVYAATKHAIIGYANALRMELDSKGIYVTTVNPGPIETDFLTLADPAGKYKKAVRRYMLNPDRVAKKVVRALFTNKREINLPVWMEAGSRIYHLVPGIMEKILKKQLNKK